MGALLDKLEDYAFNSLTEDYKSEVKKEKQKYKVLAEMDLFVMDNSIRESTVGQLRGHTLENKWEIYKEVKKCGFKNAIVASFSHMTRVDDVFVKELIESGEDPAGLFAFSEITDEARNKVPDTERVPVGLRKMKELGLRNPILEVDLSDITYDFNKFSMKQMCELVQKWISWAHDNLHQNAKVMINFRDIPDAMDTHPERVFQLTQFLARLPEKIRPYGILFEEPRGFSTPEECVAWTKYIKKIMLANKWDAPLLVHVHEKFGYGDVTTLEVLMSGATGIWASICREGAALGHASSCVTLLNLIRFGNTKVLKKYNCTYLRQAAINVTRITTGEDPNSKQPVYGTRALDMVLNMKKEEFDLAEFFGEKAPVRICTLSSPEMIRARLIELFGDDPSFTEEQALKMKEVMLEDLRNNRKEEYMSMVGMALLYDRAGGAITEKMRDEIEKLELQAPHEANLIKQVREMWDIWDLKDEVQGDEMLQFDSFYNGFMAPYFACYRCSDTKKALQAIDMDCDGQVDWSEFSLYLKWAMHEYPDIKDTQELLDITFRKGLIPAMRDEILVEEEKETNVVAQVEE